MSRRTKQRIAIILCITMVIGFDNVYGYRSVFKYINSVIVTKAGEVKDKGKTDTEIGETPSENVIESDTSEPAVGIEDEDCFCSVVSFKGTIFILLLILFSELS